MAVTIIGPRARAFAAVLGLFCIAASPATERVSLYGPQAKVEDQDGRGLFLIRGDAFLARLGNPQRRAFDWDPVRKRVRVRAPGAVNAAPLILSATRGFRSAEPRRGAMATPQPGWRLGGAEQAPAALPVCPGDPRCP